MTTVQERVKERNIKYKDVLRWRKVGLTFREIGEKLGVGKARAQQVYAQASRKYDAEYRAERRAHYESMKKPTVSASTWPIEPAKHFLNYNNLTGDTTQFTAAFYKFTPRERQAILRGEGPVKMSPEFIKEAT